MLPQSYKNVSLRVNKKMFTQQLPLFLKNKQTKSRWLYTKDTWFIGIKISLRKFFTPFLTV